MLSGRHSLYRFTDRRAATTLGITPDAYTTRNGKTTEITQSTTG